MNHEKVYDIIARNVDKTVDVIMILVVQAWRCGNMHKVSVKHLPAYWMTSRFNNRKNPYLFRDTMLKLIDSPNQEYKRLTSSAGAA